VVWYAPHSAFVADDWPLLERTQQVATAHDAVGLFSKTAGAWYRPLPTLLAAAGLRLIGLDAYWWHMGLLATYVLVAVLVGAIATHVTGVRQTGVVASLTFATLAVHAEPVLWWAAGNEVVATLCVLASVYTFLVLRHHKRLGPLVPWTLVLLALTAKETAAWAPLALAGLSSRRRGTVLAPAPVAYLTLGGLYALGRLPVGSPYEWSIARIPLNVAYYVLTVMLSLPDNYGYRSALDEWMRAPLVGLYPVAMATSGLVILSIGAIGPLRQWRWRGWDDRPPKRLAVVGVSWAVAAGLPVLLTATGRTAFMASVGWAWLVAALVLSATSKGQHGVRAAGYVGWGLLLVANAWTAEYEGGGMAGGRAEYDKRNHAGGSCHC